MQKNRGNFYTYFDTYKSFDRFILLSENFGESMIKKKKYILYYSMRRSSNDSYASARKPF